jgi:enamine deaminase RidA (YjgF/YER057c/UK114 family)
VIAGDDDGVEVRRRVKSQSYCAACSAGRRSAGFASRRVYNIVVTFTSMAAASDGRASFPDDPGAPAPVGPFSHLVEVDGWLFVTGQMPTDPRDDSAPLPVGIEAQTRRVMDNLVLVLRGAGLRLEHVAVARAVSHALRARLRADERCLSHLLPGGPSAGAYLRGR